MDRPRPWPELFGEWADKWLETIVDRKPKTRESYESIVHRHLRPRFGEAPIAAIDYPMVLAFVAELRTGRRGGEDGAQHPRRDADDLQARRPFRCAQDNPVVDVACRSDARAEMVFLEPDQIMDLAGEVANPPPRTAARERRVDGYPEYGLFVRFAAFTGLRAGELVGLRVKDSS